MSSLHLLESIRSLPRSERLRLVERVIHELNEDGEGETRPTGAAPSLLGLMADEPALVDEACARALAARDKSRLRTPDEE